MKYVNREIVEKWTETRTACDRCGADIDDEKNEITIENRARGRHHPGRWNDETRYERRVGNDPARRLLRRVLGHRRGGAPWGRVHVPDWGRLVHAQQRPNEQPVRRRRPGARVMHLSIEDNEYDKTAP